MDIFEKVNNEKEKKSYGFGERGDNVCERLGDLGL